VGDVVQVVFDECYSGVFYGYVCARVYGDVDLGLGECGGVVDVVAGHGYDLFLGLKALDYFVFLFW